MRKLGKQRIWELDALRGICIIGMLLVHLRLDASAMGLCTRPEHPVFQGIRVCGAWLLIALSGLSSTLGHHCLRRGCQVFACGMLLTLLTCLAWQLGLASRHFRILFGILHLLGVSMLLTPFLQHIAPPILWYLAIAILLLGYRCMQLTLPTAWLFPFGLVNASFCSIDWFPLLPYTGWYLLGFFAGKQLYTPPVSHLPERLAQHTLSRFLCFCGRHSLMIYLLHQPLLYALLFFVRQWKER